MSRDELAGKGIFCGRKAKSDRRQQLTVQIEVGKALREKLGSFNGEWKRKAIAIIESSFYPCSSDRPCRKIVASL
ncbi:MAG: hypothetical protein M3O33_11590 [Cyanobacteriota bacterium]|nr:hypothetical protein [Cyanobacteriota bacterium]